MKNIIIAYLLMIAYGANANDYKMDFVNPSINGSKYRVTLKMSAQNKSFSLGSTNFRFAYNTSELANPKIIETQFPTNFGRTTMMGSNPTTGIVSLNTVCKEENNGRSIHITTTGSELITIEFDVLKSVTQPVLTWRLEGKGPKTVAIKDVVNTVPDAKIVSKQKKPSSSLRIAPNPSTDNIKIVFESMKSGNVNVVLFDVFGKEIKNQVENTSTGLNTFQMSLNDVPNGAYFIAVKSENGNLTQKIIKQQ